MDPFLLERMRSFGDDLAVAEPNGGACSYRQVVECCDAWLARLAGDNLAGVVVSIEGEYGLDSIGLLLALVVKGAIVVPLSRDSKAHHDKFLNLAMVQRRIQLGDGPPSVTSTGMTAEHEMYGTLRQRGHPGLVLFTSGSTGNNKAVVHDLSLVLEKYKTPRQKLRTLVFLQLDHIGGINTLFYALSNGGAVIVPAERSPKAVCDAIETYKVELLPTSPTFLNLLLLSQEPQRRDLSSLKLITYGTEPMPQSTLDRVGTTFPNVKLQQTYGMTELGILRSQSRDSQSLWVRIGGQEFATKVKDGRLWVKAQSAMLGYLNAPSPFDEEGYFDTGDRVEVEGEWMKILGRESEIINVGGSKVYPAEVESALLEMSNVVDVAVRGEKHPITGQIVSATLRLEQPEELNAFKVRMRVFLKDKLPSYAVPAKIAFTEAALHSERYKRMRK